MVLFEFCEISMYVMFLFLIIRFDIKFFTL